MGHEQLVGQLERGGQVHLLAALDQASCTGSTMGIDHPDTSVRAATAAAPGAPASVTPSRDSAGTSFMKLVPGGIRTAA